MYGISCFQLLPELVGHDIEILRINDGRHPVSHGCEFFPAETQEFKQSVIGVNYGKISIKPAPEHCSRNVVIQVEHFRLRTLLCRNIHADRYDRRPPVFSHYSASHVMNPDVRTILFLHAVFHHIFNILCQLLHHCPFHHILILGMHTVGNAAFNIRYEFGLVRIAQVIQHPAVDEIKRKVFLYVTAHHTAGQGLIQKLLSLTNSILHNQRLRVMLRPPLAAGRLGKVEALELPALPLHYHGKETAYMPGIHRIFQSNLRRQVTHMLRYNLFIYLRQKQCKRLRNLQHILSEIGKHLIPAPC